MTTLLQTEVPVGSGFLHNPVFAVSGAIHVFRALENLRQAATAAAQTAAHIEDTPSSSPHLQHHQLRQPRRQQDPHQPDGVSPSRHGLGKSHPSAPASSPGSTISPPSTTPPPKAPGSDSFAPWQLQPSACDDIDASRGLPAASAPVIATGFAAVAFPSVECSPRGPPHPHPRPRPLMLDDGSWEDLAALYASALASGHATWPASSSSASSASSASSSSASSSSAEPSSEPPIDTPVHPAAHLWRPQRCALSCGGPTALHPGPLLPHHHHHHHRHCRRRSLSARHPSGPQLQLQLQQQQQQSPGPASQAGPQRDPHPESHLGPSRVTRPGQERLRCLQLLTPPLPLPYGGSGGGGGGAGAVTAGQWGSGVLPPRALAPVRWLGPCGALWGRKADGEQATRAVAAREGHPTAGSPPQWLQAAYTLAGAVSRTAAQMAIHPLDTLKTRMQVRMPTPQLQVWRAVMACAATRPRALAAWAGAAGARDLLLGLGACVAGVLPSAAIYFAAEPWVRARMGEATSADGESPLCRLTASAAAATLSALIRVPADVVKHRVQAYAYPSSAGAVRSILATRGPAGLYAGFGATLLRDAPEIVIQFTVYRKLKAVLDEHRRRSSDGDGGGGGGGGGGGAAEHLFLGGAAGAAAALATTPLDVIKTQLQCGAATSVPAAAAAVLRAGGPAALFGGLAPRLLQTTLCSALFFTCFEASKARLKDLADSAAAAAPTMAAPPPAPLPPLAAAAREVATALKPPLMFLPQQHRRNRWRRSRRHGSSAAAAAAAAAAAVAAPAGVGIWEDGECAAGGRLAPVALYAYTYAGAAAPAAAVTAAAAVATAAVPSVVQFQAA
ncbi:hypothetical protein PLESTB_001373400 [Pleodorina starrii]|uniref:Uncharacterized protein n=1 Tax=Pleodorina starrii TaxID=330485 RepID=A0A9W6BUD1_9CHLO|nr:hypothetical protein PLESTM_000411700 [Pleodorina starrii]GLC58549.1 hypothetical protein PLESTB_001373400 [Pleodorina starrii]GLC74202.1 hypothetical protein PLESTF_001473200 [Pleodorina starrii]